MNPNQIEDSYKTAKEKYGELGVDTIQVLEEMENIALSVHCWQGDDVGGFESPDAVLDGGGIQATGNYPGKARTIKELQQDLESAFSLIPGNHRVNLHAIYGDFGGRVVERNEITSEFYYRWIDWAKIRN